MVTTRGPMDGGSGGYQSSGASGLAASTAIQVGTQLYDSYQNRKLQKEMNRANADLQREFAQHGIKWRVQDAIEAGLHPLAALGASGASASPSFQVGNADYGLAKAGQDISNAMRSSLTQEEKELRALQLASLRADVDGKAIENQIRARQLSNLSGSPSFPGSDNFIPGQGNSPVKVKAAERTASQSGRHAQQAGWVPDVGYARTDTGLVPVPSQDVKERIEDQIIPELMWAVRNYLLPNMHKSPPSKSQLPKGAISWRWNYLSQEWRPYYGDEETWSQFQKQQSLRNRHRR